MNSRGIENTLDLLNLLRNEICRQYLNNVDLLKFDLDTICDALLDLLLFVQFKKCQKHPWRSVTFSKMIPNLAKRHI